jgi:hypothetical protein
MTILEHLDARARRADAFELADETHYVWLSRATRGNIDVTIDLVGRRPPMCQRQGRRRRAAPAFEGGLERIDAGSCA